jgi:hypothetical protein
MPLFGLKPVPGALAAPAWAGSTHRGPCYVMAPDTRRARLHAANHFSDPGAVRTASGMLPTSPWMLPALVVVEAAPGLNGHRREVPDGTIMVPEDAEDEDGDAFRVLRHGFGQ